MPTHLSVNVGQRYDKAATSARIIASSDVFARSRFVGRKSSQFKQLGASGSAPLSGRALLAAVAAYAKDPEVHNLFAGQAA